MGNAERVRQLKHLRQAACGLGTRLLKLRLNKLAKFDSLALAARLALEIEDANVTAKRYRFSKYSDRAYAKKDALIRELITVLQHQDWKFGVHEHKAWPTTHIIYFEIPGCEQISFHWRYDGPELPRYENEWDGKQNSTLPKLLAFIEREFPEIKQRDAYSAKLFPEVRT